MLRRQDDPPFTELRQNAVYLSPYAERRRGEIEAAADAKGAMSAWREDPCWHRC